MDDLIPVGRQEGGVFIGNPRYSVLASRSSFLVSRDSVFSFDVTKKCDKILDISEKNINFFKLPITNASVEGLNNKAKIISRRAYGFRSVKSHILNLYHGLADLTWPKLLHTFV